jgi:hypothetical protein
MEGKFKTGDKVTFTTLNPIGSWKDPYINPKFQLGECYTVSEIGYCDFAIGGNCYCVTIKEISSSWIPEEVLELYTLKEKASFYSPTKTTVDSDIIKKSHKFKEGDYVKSNSNSYAITKKGWIGEVIRIFREGEYVGESKNGALYIEVRDLNKECETYIVEEGYFNIYEGDIPVTEITFKIGDVVQLIDNTIDSSNHIGDVGVITKFEAPYYQVKVPGHESRLGTWSKPSDLEKVDADLLPPSPTAKPMKKTVLQEGEQPVKNIETPVLIKMEEEIKLMSFYEPEIKLIKID